MNYDENIDNKENQMRNCNHLFVYLSKKPLIVKCIYCGLTNKYIGTEEKSLDNFQKMQNEVFLDRYCNAYQEDNNCFNSGEFNYISEEVFNSKHPNYLFSIAKEINKDANIEELFSLMKQLRKLETTEERRKNDFYIDEVGELKNRYYSLIKHIK